MDAHLQRVSAKLLRKVLTIEPCLRLQGAFHRVGVMKINERAFAGDVEPEGNEKPMEVRLLNAGVDLRWR